MIKLLIADDHLLVRQGLQMLFSQVAPDIEVIGEAATGIETISVLETKSVDVVLMDIEMPQMDGHHLTKRIKQHPELSKLPVIIFSSLITDSLRHKGQIVGADAQISKPEITALIKLIDEYSL